MERTHWIVFLVVIIIFMLIVVLILEIKRKPDVQPKDTVVKVGINNMLQHDSQHNSWPTTDDCKNFDGNLEAVPMIGHECPLLRVSSLNQSNINNHPCDGFHLN